MRFFCHRRTVGRCALAPAALLAAWLCAALVSAAEPNAEGIEFFEKRVRPLLVQNCLECHADKHEGGLRLDSAAALAAGGDSGPAIAPGNPEASLLLAAVRYQDEPKMPPAGKLPDDAIAALETWIKLGAPWPADSAAPGNLAEQARKSHWAFQPVVSPPPPRVTRAAWPQTPLDQFVLAKLEAQGLTPSPQSDRRTLIRRASYDLLGLPPTAADVEAFVADPDPRAFDRVIERLLASPAYGERWARHWLDVARYADTKGYVFTADRNYPNAYRYRDWVVRAFNDDMPYDRFLIEQIAADRLDGDPGRLAAMGFLTVGRRFLNNRHDVIDDRIDVLTRGTMALTVTCARCHDHKYDPIPTADYYSLYGVLASSNEPEGQGEYMVLADAEQPVEPHVFVRGNPGNQGPAVPRQFLEVVAGEHRQPFQQGSGRLELARAIASRDNPLTARVIVNRLWLQYFDSALVRTPSDFGLRSEPPTHPELLDYLAASLVDNGWSLKSIARMILRSATYQQASVDRAECRAADPENRLLWRMNRKRLDFEALRDSVLAASGQMDASVGGAAVDLLAAPWPRRRTLYGRIDRQNLPNLFRTFDFASPDTHSPQRFHTTVPQQALYMMNSPFLADASRALAAQAEQAGDVPARIERLYALALARKPSANELQAGVSYLTAENEPGAQPSNDDSPQSEGEPIAEPSETPAAEAAAPAGGATDKPAVEKPRKRRRRPEATEPPPGPPLTAWERYVQVVLMSNEFVYVD